MLNIYFPVYVKTTKYHLIRKEKIIDFSLYIGIIKKVAYIFLLQSASKRAEEKSFTLALGSHNVINVFKLDILLDPRLKCQ